MLSLWADCSHWINCSRWRGEDDLIDWTRVKDLRSEIGENDFFEVVEMFFDETDEVVASLEHTVDLAESVRSSVYG